MSFNPKVSLVSSSDTSSAPEIYTPTSTPRPEHSASAGFSMGGTKLEDPSEPDQKQADIKPAESSEQSKVQEPEAKAKTEHTATTKCKRRTHKRKGSKKTKKAESSSSDSSDSSSESSSSESDSESDEKSSSSSSSSDSSPSSSSEDESRKKKSKKNKKSRKDKKSKKSRRRSVNSTEASSESEDESDQTSESEAESRRSKKLKKRSKQRRRNDPDSSSDADEDEDPIAKATEYLKSLGVKAKGIRIDKKASKKDDSSGESEGSSKKSKKKTKKQKKTKDSKRRSNKKPEFFRGDELWDNENHQYELRPTKAGSKSETANDYVFTVKRHFDWEGKYEYTDVHIHGKLLRECLQKVMENCKSVSLAEDEPVLEPDTLFLYLEDMRTYRKDLKATLKSEKKLKKKTKKNLLARISQIKCMIKYLDKDYASTKATLYPMLKEGNITFDLLWTLFRSDTIVYTATYGNDNEPRAYKVDFCNKESSFIKGVWYEVIGKYFDFDGKIFGLGNFQSEIDSFKGVRKISSLPVYPIQYHPKTKDITEQLIERGKKFVSLAGMQYKFLKGMAFMKRRGQIVKINVNGRIMADPATFRRINPNYQISNVKREDPDLLPDCCDSGSEQEQDEKPEACTCADCLASDPNANAQRREKNDEPKKRWKRVRDPKTKMWDYIQVEVDDNGVEIRNPDMPLANKDRDLEALPSQGQGGQEGQDGEEQDPPGRQDMFTDEELIIASPVVLGFAFSEKLWLELSVSGIQEISWNEGAFDSLVLPTSSKSIIRALVTAHAAEAKADNKAEASGEVTGKQASEHQNIDDVIQGKGKGLVSVLHGSPGTGKTLTAEGIAELLKCPLYCVSAGELGTNPRDLEAELTKILDVAHVWGAVLLLDEADVFLEARTAQDIHRNALVSIFLRLLEYFQGILFLTTNRVSSFDEAFQSRIHIALRYQELDFKARRKVWEIFLGRVGRLAGSKLDAFGKEELDRLARKDHLNGRQIKNAVRSAQALAVNEKAALSMTHIEKVLEVAESFDRDLKGGTGYVDAMRSYT